MFATVRSNILILLGAMVECSPSSFEEDNAVTILNLCLDSLDEQLKHKGKDPSFVLVSGAIKCLDGLLMWFDMTAPAGGRSWKITVFCSNKVMVFKFSLNFLAYFVKQDQLKQQEESTHILSKFCIFGRI